MPACQNCGKEWSWGTTFRGLIRVSMAMKCPYCGERQYGTASSGRRMMVIGLIPIPLVFIIPYISGMTVWIALALAIVISVVLIIIMPFFLKLSNEQEPYW
ncbi:TIGR04104 family putative zinc finger protein [Lentibacillus sp. CBA3610]|uniref:TIGR04104 family putative zinc finger protein n=1 Tax=Lentibacillus sp. CBA3610 TaxID=2518176 RepID=UPI001596006C|nr:TIGR04104 family putative zinc finger protein [Lentibacillus sp. CBA3610]QKY68369.1 hypothetical protein Len3610_00895 [Lentibacillus sp. CBA3610]